jgi:hypothetical protein
MTLENISAAQYLSGKLRQNLTDYNAAHRSSNYGNWIYPDKPLIAKLLADKNNFPRISVEPAGEFSDHRLGQMSADYMDKVTLRITAWTVRDLICDVNSVAAEGHTFHTGTTEYPLTELPVSSIGAVSGTVSGNPYTFVQGTDYVLTDADGDGFRDSVDWSLGGTDPDDGTNFAVTYARKASGPELARLIIQSIHSYIRQNWRLNWSEHILFNYRRIGSQPNSLDAQLGVYSHELTIQFDGINIGESIS